LQGIRCRRRWAILRRTGRMNVSSSSALVATMNADIFKVLLASDVYAIATYVVILLLLERIIHSSQDSGTS